MTPAGSPSTTRGSRLRRRLPALAGVALVQACTTAPVAEPPPASPASPTTAARAPASLVIERQWLQSWFQGTPVRIAQREDGAVSIDVPLQFCFGSGSSEVNPPLAAVLDKVAESLRRVPSARLQLVAAPGDSAATQALGQRRADVVRAQLRSRGVGEAQLAAATVTSVASVQLRIELASP